MKRFALSALIFIIVTAPAIDWRREAIEWGISGVAGTGAYILYETGPFFDEPLIGGDTDAPLIEETVPTKWLVAGCAVAGASILAIPPSNNGLETRYYYAKGFAQAVTLNAFATSLGKDIVGRYRPNADARDGASYDDSSLRDSFPSGHSSMSFTAASYLSLYLWEATGDNRSASEIIGKSLLTAALAGSATWVSRTRIEDNAHRTDDVIAGAALGCAMGAGTFYYQHLRVNKIANADIALSPTGITLIWRF